MAMHQYIKVKNIIIFFFFFIDRFLQTSTPMACMNAAVLFMATRSP